MGSILLIIAIVCGLYSYTKYLKIKNEDTEKAYRHYKRAVFFLGTALAITLIT